ncbi:MaoC/PaaZ C-terminal domain-containing protein [Lihuaxuella thermophila]|uniref:3-hydroxybutyryl-CoA dehydratase n=1 Tax=Lihuaxuella thermophila TaxID=1173111 RepID=A0A1H8CSC5_9BACL|nr:MaoC/PaaZ C-terminal domain-containing protein [Lihuaxuella thermophila]SEM97354.1 3-hydroxybutyryl-CoA dehydratase [Lihuaxuella thermophila]
MVFGKVNPTGKYWEMCEVGDRVRETRTVTVKDLFSYLGVTDDQNPLYLEENYAIQAGFEQAVVPAGLFVGWLTSLASMHLPGPGSMIKELRLSFPQALKLGEKVNLSLELTHKCEREKTVTLKASVTSLGKSIVEGEIDVFPPRPLRSLLDNAFENF